MVLAGPFTVATLADALGAQVEGDGERLLYDVRGLSTAGPEHLSFLANRRYTAQLQTTRAGAVLISPRARPPATLTVLRCADPYAAFARSLLLFHPQPWPQPGVAPQAWVDPDATVHPSATIEAFAWVGPEAVVGPKSWIEAGVRVGAGAAIGAECRLMANSVVCAGCQLGDRVWLNPGAVVGGEGFGFAPTAAGHVKIPQVGRAVIGSDVELGANACVDRAAMGETRVGRGTKTDNFVQVGHAAQIGADNLMVAYAGVAGSSRVGDRVVMAARASVLGHLSVGDGAQVGVASVVHGDVAEGTQVSGVPAIAHRTWLRAATASRELPALLKDVRRLQARVNHLEAMMADAPLDTPPIPPDPEVPAGLDIQRILSMLPHRYPFLMLDRILSVEPGVRAVGVKCVSINEPHFQGHFPQQPVMPGVLIAETFAQLAGVVALSAHPDLSGKAVYLLGLDRVRFRKPVIPGDRLQITCEKRNVRRNIWRFSALAEVDGQRVADGEVMATIADRAATETPGA